MNILVIDDEKDVREVVCEILEGLGNTVSSANNGKEGLARIESEEFDLVVSDINMPIMNGVEFGLELRRNNLKIPIIYISGRLSENSSIYSHEFLKIRPTALFPKPLSINKLEGALKSFK